MADPMLVITPVAFNSAATFDLLALTGPIQGDQNLAGFSGSDYCWQQTPSGQEVKVEGGNQCTFDLFGNPLATYGNNNVYRTITTEDGNSWNATVAVNMGASQINAGVVYPRMLADQSLRTFGLVFGIPTGGTWLLTATLGDGSVPPQTLQLSQAFPWVTINYRSLVPCNLSVEVRSTATPTGGSTCFPQLAYVTRPIPPQPPTRTYSY